MIITNELLCILLLEKYEKFSPCYSFHEGKKKNNVGSVLYHHYQNCEGKADHLFHEPRKTEIRIRIEDTKKELRRSKKILRSMKAQTFLTASILKDYLSVKF